MKSKRFSGGDVWYRLGEQLGTLSSKVLLMAARCYARSNDPRTLDRLREIQKLYDFAVDELKWDGT